MAPHEGGPPRVVAGLAGAQCASGTDAHVFCGDGSQLEAHLQYWRTNAPELSAVTVHTAGAPSGGIYARAIAVRAWLRANLASYDVVHIHSLWRLLPMFSAIYSRRLRVPYLIAPHTALSPWALDQKRPKKALARVLVWNRLFDAAAGFHALNELEAEEIRDCVGPAGPRAFIVPNGVSLREFPQENRAIDMTIPSGTLGSLGADRPFILFLARLHVMKGPDLLLEAFASIALECPDLQLGFAGPDFGMLETLRRRAAELRLAHRVHFLGQVSGPTKLWLLGKAVCLCQPSRSEGFSLSILEAMASTCPVVISDCCKFPEVAEQGAGIVVPMDISEIAAGLRLYAGDAARRVADGRAARQLVARRYTWEIVCKQAELMYEQVASGRVDDNAMSDAQR
jgi:glycosyltransferase involved in cell wall biosynthesis